MSSMNGIEMEIDDPWDPVNDTPGSRAADEADTLIQQQGRGKAGRPLQRLSKMNLIRSIRRLVVVA